MTEQIRKEVADAQIVLVGIGELFGIKPSAITVSPYKEIIEEIGEKEDAGWLLSFIMSKYIQVYGNQRVHGAYLKLAELLEGKNYFIVTTCMDNIIYMTELEEDRIVSPCGLYTKLQCERDCQNEFKDAADWVELIWNEANANKGTLEKIKKPICKICGKTVAINCVLQENYEEEGYLSKWETYTKWLQETLNKKICILELGVGLEYPTVIRWPFEKIAFFNQKASFFRVHSKLYQMSEELKERGLGIAENPIDFLIK